MTDDPWQHARDDIAAEHVDLDIARIIECFDRHAVEYLIVGGVAATLHGASRPTGDFDSLPATTTENLTRLATALKELGAYLRVEDVSDEETRALTVLLDALMLKNMDISTWRTDAGDIDVLTALPTRDGGRTFYDDLATRARRTSLGGTTVTVAALVDIIASKDWSNARKTTTPSPSCANCNAARTRTPDASTPGRFS